MSAFGGIGIPTAASRYVGTTFRDYLFDYFSAFKNLSPWYAEFMSGYLSTLTKTHGLLGAVDFDNPELCSLNLVFIFEVIPL
jgi:hypothetical protein